MYSFYEKLYTLVDFMAALAFVIGSALFFSPAYSIPATRMFLVGSLLFAARPTVTVAREFHVARLPVGHHDHPVHHDSAEGRVTP